MSERDYGCLCTHSKPPSRRDEGKLLHSTCRPTHVRGPNRQSLRPRSPKPFEPRGCTAEQTVSYVRSWFGDVAEDPANRLWPFARTGGEGSMAGLWLDPDRATRIVHLAQAADRC